MRRNESNTPRPGPHPRRPRTKSALSLIVLALAGVVSPVWASGGQQIPPVSDASCPVELPNSLGLSPLDPVETPEVGWSPGSFAVTTSGEATYTIPLSVPPGRAGMVPNLAISYSSDGGDGPLGRGFGLSGLSRVTRCVKNLEIDGEAHAIAYDDTDAYCLDGQRLLLVNDQGNTKEYRTIPDSHVRVLAVHTAEAAGPVFFEVDEPSGVRKWYGKSVDARVLARNGYVAGWALSEVTDQNLNGIRYTYESSTTVTNEPQPDGTSLSVSYTGEQRLKAIQYTTPNPQRSVELEYDDMPVVHAFSGRMDFTRSKRLKKISMFGPQHELVRDYEVSYTGSDLPSSRLSQVQECTHGWLGQSYGRRCLPATRFDWSGGAVEGGFQRVPTSIQVGEDDAWVLADVNGDGLDDVVLSTYAGAVLFRVALATGDAAHPFQDPMLWLQMPPPPGLSGRYDMLPADLDNDGRIDLVLQNEQDESSSVRWLRAAPANGQFPLPHFEPVTTTIPRDPQDAVNQFLSGENSLKLGDFDGDGAIDVLRCARQATLVGDASSWQPGEYFNLQLNNDLYVVAEEMRFYRNEGSASFGIGASAFATGCESATSLLVAPVFSSGKSSVLSDGYGVFLVSVVGGLSIGPYAYSHGAYAAIGQPNAGGAFEDVATGLYVGADLPEVGVDSVGWHDQAPFDQSRRPLVADFNGDGVADLAILKRETRQCLAGEQGRKSKDAVPGQPSNEPACWTTDAVITLGQSPVTQYASAGLWGTTSPVGQTVELQLSAPRPIVKPLIDQALAFHYDDDTLADILFPLQGSCSAAPDTTCYAVLRSTGDLGAPLQIIKTDIPYRWETTPGEYASPKASTVQPTDTDGNGRADLVVLEGTNELVVYRRPVTVGRVSRIIEGRNPRSEGDPKFVPSVEIEYGSLVDRRQTTADLVAFGEENVGNNQPGPTPNDMYQARWHSPNCTWPVSCVAGSRQVVSKYRLTDGLEGKRSVAMLYRDGRYDVSGHRFLGFGAVMRVDLDALSGSATFMDNEQYDTGLKVYPFAGLPTATWEWRPALPGQPDAQQLELTFTGTLYSVVPTAGGSYFRYAAVSRVWTDEAQYNPANGIYGLLDKVEEESHSPSAVLSARTHMVTNVDPFGNVTSENTKAEGIDGIETAAYTFDNDLASWLLGRERERLACSTVDGVTQCRSMFRWYDAKGQLVHTRSGDPSDLTTILHTWYTRDNRGNVRDTVLVDGLGEKRSTCATYDGEGVFIVGTNNSESLETRAEYHPGLGVKIGVRDANDLVTRWAVDGFGRVREQSNPDKTSIHTSLSLEPGCGDDGMALCAVSTTETSGGSWQRTFRDGLGRTVRTLTAGPDRATCSHAGSCENGALLGVDERYDHFGRRTQVSRPYILGDATTPKQYEDVEYDAVGREVKRSLPSGLVIETQYEGMTTVTSDGFAKTTTAHDGMGRIAWVEDSLETTTSYTYGPFGVTALVQVNGAAAETTAASYDPYGRLVEKHDPDQGTTVTIFNGYGEPKTTTDAAGRTVTLQRDGIGRVVQRQDMDGSSIFEYDSATNGKGRLSRQTLVAQGATVNERRFTYDGYGRLTGATIERAGEQFDSEITYDEDGRPWEVSYPEDGSGVRFSVRHHYDSRGNLWAVDGMRLGHGQVLPGYQRLWELEETHPSGRTRLESFGNGASTSTSIDPATLAVMAIETTVGGQSPTVQALSYDYDARGNLRSRQDALQGNAGLGGVSEWFDYDALGRLVCTHVGTGAIEPQGPCALDVAYLPNGNIDFKGDVGEYTYGDVAHPHAVTLTSGVEGAGEEYQYDAVGNQTRRGLVGITYTARNKPSSYELSNADVVRFEYTADGERLRKLQGSGGNDLVRQYVRTSRRSAGCSRTPVPRVQPGSGGRGHRSTGQRTGKAAHGIRGIPARGSPRLARRGDGRRRRSEGASEL